jgi:hypothetical protein
VSIVYCSGIYIPAFILSIVISGLFICIVATAEHVSIAKVMLDSKDSIE